MKNREISRRKFLKNNALLGLGAVSVNLNTKRTIHRAGAPAILGGSPAWNERKWPEWPVWRQETDEARLLQVIRSGVWSRAKVVEEFEKKWADAVGVKRCLTVVNGTNALVTALSQAGVQAGDEVIIPPYTFIATATAVLSNSAIPIFADIDPATYQIDPKKIEEKITAKTKALIPVHILGQPADMDSIMAVAKKHGLAVIEDACQAHLAEYDHKKVGSIGLAGCFSFQNSKNLPIGEGGAVVSNNDEFMDRCFSYSNFGFPYGTSIGTTGGGSFMQGTKVRFSEYQAAIGLAQMERLEGQTKTRGENAEYLRNLISEIPGIVPYKVYPKVTRSAFHLFPFRYKKEGFKGLSREAFLEALRAEGVPCSGGYSPLNKQNFLEKAFKSKNFTNSFPKELLNFKNYTDRNHCKENDLLCEEAVWLTQNMLLGSRDDMTDIANAIKKVNDHAERIKNIK